MHITQQADAARPSTRYAEKQAAQAQRSTSIEGSPAQRAPPPQRRALPSPSSVVAVARRVEDAVAVVVEIGVPAAAEALEKVQPAVALAVGIVTVVLVVARLAQQRAVDVLDLQPLKVLFWGFRRWVGLRLGFFR